MEAGPPAEPPGVGLHPSSYACSLACSVKLLPLHVYKQQQQSRCHHKRHMAGKGIGATIFLVPLGWILHVEAAPKTASRCFRRSLTQTAYFPTSWITWMISTPLCARARSICHVKFKSLTANKRGALATRHSLRTERKLRGFLLLWGSAERVSPWGHPNQQSAGKETVMV